MHRFSPYSTGAIKGRNNGKKKNKKKKLTKIDKETNLLQQLITLGYDYERSNACIPYLEKIDINNALDFFENIEPYLLKTE